jgi:hypothetical protein
MLGDFVGPVANMFSDVKIAEGESPLPMDRVFLKFNFYNDLSPARWTDPTQPIHNVDLYRYVFGFEKTFMDGQISLGLRVPFYTMEAEAKQLTVSPSLGGPTLGPGGPGFTDTELGNISAIAKGILWEDQKTGNIISVGATVSMPTATSKLLNFGQSTVAYMQPFGAFILNRGDLFVQGFSSITAPLVSAESTVMFNDVGVGYWMYRSNDAAGWLTAVVPTFEVHVATPLRSQLTNVSIFGATDGLQLYNVVDLTLGSTFQFGERSTLGVAAVVPVTGPRLFDMEAIVQFNYRF